MFGLESGKDQGIPEVLFDLEQDVKDPKKMVELHEKILERMQEIKKMLQSGEDKELYDQLGALLYGYQALLTVAERSAAPKEKKK